MINGNNKNEKKKNEMVKIMVSTVRRLSFRPAGGTCGPEVQIRGMCGLCWHGRGARFFFFFLFSGILPPGTSLRHCSFETRPSIPITSPFQIAVVFTGLETFLRERLMWGFWGIIYKIYKLLCDYIIYIFIILVY